MPDDSQATVLVVEDDPGVIRLQQIRLERAGYQVRVATTPADALTQIREGSIDLMLLDQNLQGELTGLELYLKVKESGVDIPAILVTGFSGDSIVLQSFRAGVYDFVPKTSDYMDYLLPTIERVLKKRRTECQLVESEAHLASIVRSTLDAVLTVDEQQCIGVFNPAAEQMFGLEVCEAKKQSIKNLLPAWTVERQGKNGDSTAEVGHWETEAARADGTRFPVELSVSWVEANRKRFWTVVARDVSDRKRAQQERERFIREQEARNQVDRLKDEFLAMLAHELRNPLAPIRNALELIRLESAPQPPDVQSSLNIIDRQVSHLVRLVEDLLDVSRISEGKIVLQKQPIDIVTVVSRALETSQPLIQERKHLLRVDQTPERLVVEGDLVRLVQVLSNLLNNAAKYTPEGGQIDLIVQREGKHVVIRVRDTGMGISPEMVPRLFTLFTQSKRTLDRAEGGLGIGLTLVRRLTEKHGGSVEAFSAGLGKGSEFLLRLPRSRKEPVLVEPPREPSEPPATIQRRILVVDDNKDSARTLSRLLTVMGHKVSTAHDGNSALQHAEEFVPDIIVLDIGLPGMDGYEVSKRLRQNERQRNTVLIALTGYGSPEDREQSQQAGFNAHLVKPVDVGALQELLRRPLNELLGKKHPA